MQGLGIDFHATQLVSINLPIVWINRFMIQYFHMYFILYSCCLTRSKNCLDLLTGKTEVCQHGRK